jgi:O-antigen ligase
MMKKRATASWFRFLQILYVISLLFAIVPYGSVHDPAIALVGVLFGALALCSSISPLRLELRAPLGWAIVLTGTIVVAALLQTLPLGISHPSYAATEQILGLGNRTISASPSATIVALLSLILPVLAFATGLIVFQKDSSAQLLFRTVAIIALVGAVLGLYEFSIAPGQLLFQPRRAQMGGVSAFFVNRNTAATFLGIGVTLWYALLLQRLQKLGMVGLQGLLLRPDSNAYRNTLLTALLFVSFLIMIIALFLTKSRAGIAASLVGIFITSVAMLQSGSKFSIDFWQRRSSIILSALVVVAILGLYGSQFIGRLKEANVLMDGRWCFYKGMLAAIIERPFTGLGFGTFRFTYPAYRDPACFSLDLMLDRGHNGYLEIAMGMGVLSLVVVASAIYYFGRILLSGIVSRHRMRPLPAAGLGSLVIAVLHTATDFSLQILGVACFLASILAAGVVASCPQKKRYKKNR